jgi:hypothetical protein
MKKKTAQPAAVTVRDRILELRRIRAGDLVPSPVNWRAHPPAQRAALRSMLARIGFAGVILVRRLPDERLQIIDGHLRTEDNPDLIVPVAVTDLDENEAKLLIASFDPLSAMAEADTAALDSLLAELHHQSPLDQIHADRHASWEDVADEPPSGMDDDGLAKGTSVRVLISVPDIRLFEQAMAATGIDNRAESLLEMCRCYLEQQGQSNIP